MGGGGIASQYCPLRYRAIGDIAAILSQIAVEWVTKTPRWSGTSQQNFRRKCMFSLGFEGANELCNPQTFFLLLEDRTLQTVSRPKKVIFMLLFLLPGGRGSPPPPRVEKSLHDQVSVLSRSGQATLAAGKTPGSWSDSSHLHFKLMYWHVAIGTRKEGHYEGVFSLEESLECLESVDSLESLANAQILLCFPKSVGFLRSHESLNSLENPENGLS